MGFLMFRILCLCGLMTLLAGAALAVPTISYVDGEVSDGQTLTLWGAEFGFKGVPEPWCWDYITNNVEYDDDNLVPGDTIPVGPGEYWPAFYPGHTVQYGEEDPRVPGRAYFTKTGSGAMRWYDPGDADDAKRLYINWWLRSDDVENIGYTKFLRVTNDISPTYPNRMSWCEKVITYKLGDAECIDYTADTDWWSTISKVQVDTWNNMEISLDSSISEECDQGLMTFQVNGTDTHQTNYWAPERLHYVSALGQDINVTLSSHDANFDWSEVYIDTTFARVMLGNDEDFANCTHKEIQIPSLWEEDQLAVTVNLGTFAPGEQAYLFVVDRTGVPSAGLPVLVSDVYSEDMPGVPGVPFRAGTAAPQ
jgi:hypothetical protein